MARKHHGGGDEAIDPDLTPMIDVAFQLITFFVMLMTLAKDEQARKVRLPIAQSAPVVVDEELPDQISVNVAYLNDSLEAVNTGGKAFILSWGRQLDLSSESGWKQFEILLKNEANFSKQSAKEKGVDLKKDGLPTTLILRIAQQVDYGVFRRVMDIARTAGFTKYQLKAEDEEGSK